MEQLRRYHDAFAAEQVLVLIYDDFRDDNAAVVRSVLRFLEVDEDVELPAVQANPSVAVRSLRLDGAAAPARRRRERSRRGPRRGRPRPALRTRRLLGGWARRALYSEPPAPDERVMLELRGRFAPEVIRARRIPAPGPGYALGL